MFPIPRITESFIDGVMYELGWCRFTDKYPVVEGQLNADYLGTDSVAELKISEEEPLLKSEHQKKVSSLFKEHLHGKKEISIDLEFIPEIIRREFENQIARPFQTKIKLASKQMKKSALVSRSTGSKVIIAVNNGFSYLNAENFERIFVSKAKRDSRSIDYAACITVDYHQGEFDAYIFCTTRVHAVNASDRWDSADDFIKIVTDNFANGMSAMMKDQLNPDLWNRSLPPVKDIRFIRDGVEYVRHAPHIPDSRVS
jgi:hypothetical protein